MTESLIRVYMLITASFDVTTETNSLRLTNSADRKPTFLSRAKINIQYAIRKKTTKEECDIVPRATARLPIVMTFDVRD